MDNAYTADVTFDAGSLGSVTVHYDYTALAAIATEVGEDVFKILTGGDLESFAKVLAIGLRLHHPEITYTDVLAASPPLMPAQEAVNGALMYANWGPKGLPDPEDQAKAAKPKKKRRSRATK